MSPKRTTVKALSVKVKPAFSGTICMVVGAFVTRDGTLKEIVETSQEVVKVWLAIAPATGAPPWNKWTATDAGMNPLRWQETVEWNDA